MQLVSTGNTPTDRQRFRSDIESHTAFMHNDAADSLDENRKKLAAACFVLMNETIRNSNSRHDPMHRIDAHQSD